MSMKGDGGEAVSTQAGGHPNREPDPGSNRNSRDDRIREIAYFLWEEAGRPDGQADHHWSTAETMHDSEASERKRIEGEPPGDEPFRADPTVRRAAAE
jgi:hypothetical protein